ncbi:7-cyano-7-deazaguanine synthase [compost metagenome]
MSNITKDAVILYSGGMDSTVLLHDLLKQGYRVHPLFFSYGQGATFGEKVKASYWLTKYNINAHLIFLPKMDWTSSSTVKGSGTEYVEARNVIFLSYAMSYAEANKIPEIYTGFIGLNYYPDTDPLFVKMMNEVSTHVSGVQIKAPYVRWGKDDVFQHALNMGMDGLELLDNTISCNLAFNDITCGECPDCLARADYRSWITAE